MLRRGILLWLLAAAPALADSALRASLALPDKYREAIVRISADDGAPDPPEWYFICRAAHSNEGIVSFTVRDRKIVSQKPSLDMRVLLGDFSAIDLAQVRVDSRGAWEIARRYVSNEKGAALGSVCFLLTQKGQGASPIWSLWCYAPGGSYLGLLKLLASTGDVIQWE
ncbi:MAG: hypothetical protein N2322_00395 [Terrimicrobiaceae bacterium]|nr:hypothetical protein [Terrimicrobiaceae bacterium]